ncbi:hypothetical protein R50072_16200 [Simiduia litorea]|uniref:hypothetical protein n=1 Tax=Simiduia litorea TaxID=1435348 RepID=UPI0036F37479
MGNWTSWLIIIAVVALAVGPVMMFQPSAGQKKLARMRAFANRQGVRVALASMAIPELLGSACYSLPWVDRSLQGLGWQLIRKSYPHEIHLNDFWSWQSEEATASVKQVLHQQLPLLPDSVVSVIASPGGLGVYWRESGSDKELEFLLVWLQETQRLLKSAS